MQQDLGWSSVALRAAIEGRDFGTAAVTIFGPGMLWRCPVSNVMRIPRQELLEAVRDSSPGSSTGNAVRP